MANATEEQLQKQDLENFEAEKLKEESVAERCGFEKIDHIELSGKPFCKSQINMVSQLEICSKNKSFESDLVAKLNLFRLSSLLTDVTVKVNDQCFECHGFIMAAASGYIRSLLESKSKWMQVSKVITLKFDDANITKDIVQYCYTGNLLIADMSNICEYYQQAHDLQIPELQKRLENTMIQNVNSDNCLKLQALAIKYKILDLKKLCQGKVITECDTVMKSQAFLKLNYVELVDFIKQVDRKHSEDILNASISWVLFNDKVRSERVVDILRVIPLKYCKQETLKKTLKKCKESWRNYVEIKMFMFDAILSGDESPCTTEEYKTNSVAKREEINVADDDKGNEESKAVQTKFNAAKKLVRKSLGIGIEK